MADTMIRLEIAMRRRQRQLAIWRVIEIVGAMALVAAGIYLWWK